MPDVTIDGTTYTDVDQVALTDTDGEEVLFSLGGSGGGSVSVTLDDDGNIKITGSGGSGGGSGGSSEKWKLIRKFTLESEVSCISVSEDDDGNPFETTELKIIGFTPEKYTGTGTLSSYGTFAIIDENGGKISPVGCGSQKGYGMNNSTTLTFGNTSYKRFVALNVEIRDEFLDTSFVFANNQGDANGEYVEANNGSFATWSHFYRNGLTSIKHFMIGQNGIIPAGTIFNVFAKVKG